MSKFAVLHVFILCAYLSTTCLNWCINHPCKRVLKSYSVQCIILRSLLRAVCQTPHVCITVQHDVGLSLWPVSLKVFGCYSNLKENVSNNFKYSYLICWAIMFLLQLGCYGLRRNLWRDCICISYLIWNRLLLSVHLFFKSMYICLAQHWTLFITCWCLSHI